MELVYHAKFLKDLEQINDSKILEEIESLINLLKSSRNLHCIPNIKRLAVNRNYFRYRIGDYRVGFVLYENNITLKRVALRKDFYRLFPFLFS